MPSEVESESPSVFNIFHGVKIKVKDNGGADQTLWKFSWMRAWKRVMLVMRREREERYVSDVLVPWFQVSSNNFPIKSFGIILHAVLYTFYCTLLCHFQVVLNTVVPSPAPAPAPLSIHPH